MPAVTRIGDTVSIVCNMHISHCCPHGATGINTSGGKVLVNGLPIHRVDDGGIIFCPHFGKFLSESGNASVLVGGRPITRIGDRIRCTRCGKSGRHTSGSPNVMSFG